MSYKLSETSDLVLLFEKGANYQTPCAKKFLSHLNLTPGKKLHNLFSNYFFEITRIINNRKYIIHKFCSDFLSKHGSSAQLIFLACGWDPVLIKMQELFPKNKLFGVDNDIKEIQKLTKKILPSSHIAHIEGDIIKEQHLLNQLFKKGWNPSQPTGIVAEGISYYVAPSDFWKTLSSLKEASSSYFFLCGDFLLPLTTKYVSKKGLKMGKVIFDAIKEGSGIPEYHAYSQEDLKNRILDLKLMPDSFKDFEAVEKERVGQVRNWKKGDCYLMFFATVLS